LWRDSGWLIAAWIVNPNCWREMGKTFLITGGAGFLGINLCRYLLSRHHSVRSLDIAPFEYPERSSIDVIRGDIRDRDTVSRAMDGVDIVVHCAAALPLCTREEIFSTNIAGTRVVLESALRNGVSRFIHISSTAVYGIPDHHPICEHDRLSGVGPYGESKIEAEKLCEKFRLKRLCVPILRPKSFVGPERLGAFEVLYNWAYEGRRFPVLGSGSNRYQLLDVEDLCEAIDLCASSDSKVVNDTFNIAAKEFGTMRDNFQAVLDRAGYGKRVVTLPARPSILILKVLELLHLSPFYKWIYETAARESFVSIEHIENRLGFVPRYSNRDALIRNYDWYVAHRDQIRRASGTSHRVTWRKGALRFAQLLF
jgi:nucleoside-diphosphate-sugar epimerase